MIIIDNLKKLKKRGSETLYQFFAHIAYITLEDSFMMYLGGCLHIVESFDEAFKTLDMLAQQFDSITPIEGYTIVYQVTNNAGGPSWAIPTNMYQRWLHETSPSLRSFHGTMVSPD